MSLRSGFCCRKSLELLLKCNLLIDIFPPKLLLVNQTQSSENSPPPGYHSKEFVIYLVLKINKISISILSNMLRHCSKYSTFVIVAAPATSILNVYNYIKYQVKLDIRCLDSAEPLTPKTDIPWLTITSDYRSTINVHKNVSMETFLFHQKFDAK